MSLQACFVMSLITFIHREQVLKLLDNGSAYHCFCTEDRLALLRKEAIKCRQVPKYDNRCRHYNKDEVKEMLKKNQTYCIRFKVYLFPFFFKS